MLHQKPSNSPIPIALLGFDNQDEQEKLTSLFNNAQYWQQPWQIVEQVYEAEFLLVFAQHEDDLVIWYEHEKGFTKERLIAYSKQRLNTANWHLPHVPSTIEFTALLKEIALARNAKLTKSSTNNTQEIVKKQEPKFLIVGSIGSGKTSTVNLLTENSVSTEAKPSDHTSLHKPSTTVAMDYGVLLMESTRLHIYGAPGQRRFDFMSDILLKNAQGLIILVSNKDTKPLNELNYYLNNHETFLKQHPAVIGVTHNDINPNPSLQEYLAFMQSRSQQHPLIKVDGRKPDDLLKLVRLLLAQM